MKKNFFRVLVALCVLSATVSCDVEPVDPEVVSQNPDNGGGNNGGGNNGGGSSSGDYWPMAINNQWQYESSEPQNDDPMKIIATQTIGGKLYYKINYAFTDAGTDDLTGTATTYLRKENGIYYERVEVNIPDTNGMEVTVSPYEFIMLKDNLAVGQGWTETVTQTTSYEMNIPDFPIDMPDAVTTIDFTGTIQEKGISVTVNGTTYNDVIKVKVEQDITVSMTGVPSMDSSAVSYIWFAKNVGPIKAISTSSELGYSNTMELVSYNLY